jgi:TonB family protein
VKATFKITQGAGDDFVRVGYSVSCRPRIRNRYAITLRLENSIRDHPDIVILPDRDRTPTIWVYVGRDGSIIRTQVHRSSGRPDVDRIAVDALSVAVFAPALLDGRPYAVWISLPFVVKLQQPEGWNERE